MFQSADESLIYNIVLQDILINSRVSDLASLRDMCHPHGTPKVIWLLNCNILAPCSAVLERTLNGKSQNTNIGDISHKSFRYPKN